MGIPVEPGRHAACSFPRSSAKGAALLKLACTVLLTLFVLAVSDRVLAVRQSAALERSIKFGGGAVVDFVPAGEGTVLVLGAMPDGFSVFSLDFTSGAVTKLISQTYLSRLTGPDADASTYSLHLDPVSGLLILLSVSRDTAPVALNVEDAPHLTRYRLGFPEDFAADGVAFHRDRAYFYSHLVGGEGSVTPLIVFDPGQQELSELVPERKFAIVRAILSTSDEKRLLVCGFFRPGAMLSTYELAWLSLDTGEVAVFPGTDRTSLAAAAGNSIALIRRAESHVAMGDEPAPAYRLEVLKLEDTPETLGHSVPLYSNPEWLGLGPDGGWVVVLTTGDSVRRDLWLINTATRAKQLVRKGVLTVRMSPSNEDFFVLPAEENAIERYTFVGAAF